MSNREIGVGLIGGLVATIVIDVLTIGFLVLTGSAPDTGFALIGDTAAGFFSMLGLESAGGGLLGAVIHFLIGTALGGLFGAALARGDALWVTTTKQIAILAIVYTELISVPILVLPPIILKMATSDVVQWFGFSVVMHAIYGLTLGLIVSYGRRTASVSRPSYKRSRS